MSYLVICPLDWTDFLQNTSKFAHYRLSALMSNSYVCIVYCGSRLLSQCMNYYIMNNRVNDKTVVNHMLDTDDIVLFAPFAKGRQKSHIRL